jgi:hypothetical protein
MKKVPFFAGLFLLAAMQLHTVTISSLPYGINVHLAANDVLAKVKAAGIAWIRIDIDWSVIEASKGDFQYSEADRVVDFASSNGLSVYASIGNTPAWANGKKGKNYPATNVSDWKNFITRTVYRYRDRVKYWGIWNEPNLNIFFALGKDKYVQQVLLPAARSIRTADPAAFIVGPELAHLTSPGSEWYFWLKYILEHAGDYVDIISHHIYEDHGVYYMYELLEEGDTFIPAVKTILEESGQDNKPFWITETGWNTSKYSETMQANRYLDLLHARARKNYPHKVFFYEIIDATQPNVLPWGILHGNLDAKLAYNTYKDYIAGLRPDPGNPDEGTTNKKCYAEQTAGNGAPAATNPALQKMIHTRDFLRGYSASANGTVDMYYAWNEEFQKIAMTDSRVFNLGRKILAQALELLQDGDWAMMNRPLPDDLCRDAKALTGIIMSEYPDSPMAPAARMVDECLDSSGRVSPHDLLEFHMKKDIQKFKEPR